jgi:hypothetical protein
MQRIDSRQWLCQGGQEKQEILLRLLILSCSLLGGWWVMSATAESPGTPAITEAPLALAVSQERFLQHFISRSLGRRAAAEHEGPPQLRRYLPLLQTLQHPEHRRLLSWGCQRPHALP